MSFVISCIQNGLYKITNHTHQIALFGASLLAAPAIVREAQKNPYAFGAQILLLGGIMAADYFCSKMAAREFMPIEIHRESAIATQAHRIDQAVQLIHDCSGNIQPNIQRLSNILISPNLPSQTDIKWMSDTFEIMESAIQNLWQEGFTGSEPSVISARISNFTEILGNSVFEQNTAQAQITGWINQHQGMHL